MACLSQQLKSLGPSASALSRLSSIKQTLDPAAREQQLITNLVAQLNVRMGTHQLAQVHCNVSMEL
jgi:hypothetical protein